MLWYHLDLFFKCILVAILLVIGCTAYAYYVNSRRGDNDPKKKNYHPLAILLAPITLPLFIVFYTSIFILRVATYGVFMVIFIFALIFIRKPFILEAIRKTAIRIGDHLMEVNSMLVRFFLSPLRNYQESS